MRKVLFSWCVVAIFAAVCAGQKVEKNIEVQKPPKSPLTQKTDKKANKQEVDKTETAQQVTDRKIEKAVSAETQLQMEIGLSILSNQIKYLDEASQRVLLRTHLAKLLWRSSKNADQLLAEAVAVAAIEDFEANKGEIPVSFASFLHSELMNVIRLNSPLLAESLSEKKAEIAKSDDTSASRALSAKSLIEANRPDDARKVLVQHLNNSSSTGEDCVDAVNRFSIRYPDQLTLLLEEILAVAEQNPYKLSTQSISYLSDHYMGTYMVNNTRIKGATLELKVRWIRFLFRKFSNLGNGQEKEAGFAYYALAKALMSLKMSAPDLYLQLYSEASGLLSTLHGHASPNVDGELNRFQKENNDPDSIADEARLSTDPAEKIELLKMAAKSAMLNGQLKKAFDLASDLKCEDKKNSWWCNDFYKSLAEKSIGQLKQKKGLEKDALQASAWLFEQAVVKVGDVVNRAILLEKAALAFLELKEKQRAKELLSEASKLYENMDNKVEAVLGLLEQTRLWLKIDKSDGLEAAMIAARSVNNFPLPSLERKLNVTEEYRKKRMEQVNNLFRITNFTIKILETWGQTDGAGGMVFAQSITLPGVSEAAVLGVYSGIMKTEQSAKSSQIPRQF